MTIFRLAALLLLSGTLGAQAHDKATGVVKQRMDAMGVLADSMKSIAGQLKSPSPDAAAIQAAATALRDHAAGNLTKDFPEGSLAPPTEARPEIWQDWDRFTTLANQLDLQAQGLALAAGNPRSDTPPEAQKTRSLEDFAAMPPNTVFTLIGQTCGTCHKSFRAKK